MADSIAQLYDGRVTFSFRWQTVWGPASAPQNTGVRILDYDAELLNVVRQP